MTTETKTAYMQPEAPSISMREIPVFITKSNYFRVIHVDGFFGGGTPTPGNLMLTVYSHRLPFPERAAIDGVGNEIPSKRVTHDGIEHEYEASLVMNLATAKALNLWLGNVISNTENSLKELQLIQMRNQQK
ncbi:MAG: hypothetical protein P4N59_09980 [Negativicutes bacterium]|nr:hypothetical protein [Negativicutes bacterium]